MENIRQAIERAKSQGDAAQSHADVYSQRSPSHLREEVGSPIKEITLNGAFLRSNRIISHRIAEPSFRSFDMLRTQILHAMDIKGSKILAVTSPTPACGKTVTAVNLAFSIARLSERSVLLVDLDFQKPKIATCLGLPSNDGAVGVLQGQTTLSKAIVHARVDDQRLMVLPTASTTGSGELMASRAMVRLFQDLRREYRSQTIIVDLPPILSSDDVIAILPQVDCVLLVVAVGTSKVADISESYRHLQTAEVVRVVVNKVPQAEAPYHYY